MKKGDVGEVRGDERQNPNVNELLIRITTTNKTLQNKEQN